MSVQPPIQIKFSAIELIAKSLEPPIAPIEKENIDFNFLVDIRVSEQQKEALVLTDVKQNGVYSRVLAPTEDDKFFGKAFISNLKSKALFILANVMKLSGFLLLNTCVK